MKKYVIICNIYLQNYNSPVKLTKRFYHKRFIGTIVGLLFPKYSLSGTYSSCWLMNKTQAKYYYYYLKIFAWFSKAKYNMRIVDINSVLNKESYGYKYLMSKTK